MRVLHHFTGFGPFADTPENPSQASRVQFSSGGFFVTSTPTVFLVRADPRGNYWTAADKQ